MNPTNYQPRFEDWRVLMDQLLDQVKDRDTKFQECMKLCIEQRFMIAQLALVQPSYQMTPTPHPELAEQICESLRPLLSGTDSQLQASTFGGEIQGNLTLHQTEFLWCMALETIAQVPAGTLVELSIGGDRSTIEMEIGSDCPILDKIRLSEMASIKWGTAWIDQLSAQDHRCPLGGGAVQVSFPSTSASIRRRHSA